MKILAMLGVLLLAACSTVPTEGAGVTYIGWLTAPLDRNDMEITVEKSPLAHVACGAPLATLPVFTVFGCATGPQFHLVEPDSDTNFDTYVTCHIILQAGTPVSENVNDAIGLYEHELLHCEGYGHGKDMSKEVHERLGIRKGRSK